MTLEEQQQVAAALAYFERQCGNLAREGANMAMRLEAMAQEKMALQAALQAEIDGLTKRVEELTPKAEAVS